jgi:hypothetical protein
MIPVVAIVMGIGCAIMAMYFNYRKRQEMFALYHQERMAAIDKGIELPPLPPEFFTEDGKPPSKHGTLLGGLITTFVGLGLAVALYCMCNFNVALFALIPLGVGLALLIFYFTVGKKEAEAADAERQARLARK